MLAAWQGFRVGVHCFTPVGSFLGEFWPFFEFWRDSAQVGGAGLPKLWFCSLLPTMMANTKSKNVHWCISSRVQKTCMTLIWSWAICGIIQLGLGHIVRASMHSPRFTKSTGYLNSIISRVTLLVLTSMKSSIVSNSSSIILRTAQSACSTSKKKQLLPKVIPTILCAS